MNPIQLWHIFTQYESIKKLIDKGAPMAKWFPLLISLLGYLAAAVSAPVYVASHPQVAIVLGGVATLIAHVMPSPTGVTSKTPN